MSKKGTNILLLNSGITDAKRTELFQLSKGSGVKCYQACHSKLSKRKRKKDVILNTIH